MTTHSFAACSLLAASLFFAAGCGSDTSMGKTARSTSTPSQPKPKETTPAKDEIAAGDSSKDDLGHSHERGKMLLADAGKHHALLTAHLSPKGNELDLFFETSDSRDPKPVALPLTSIKGFATLTGSSEAKELAFLPAPDEERPKGEKPGTCSHFVAKTPWLKPTDELTVAAPIELDGERFRVTWEKFNPKRFAHHEE